MRPILKLAKNTVSIFSAKIIEAAGRLIAVFIIARYLGVEEYGNYAFVNTFVMFFIICSNLGVNEIVTRQVSISNNLKQKYMSGAISIRLIIIPVVLLLYAVITTLSQMPTKIVGAILLALIGQICLSFTNLHLAIMRGLEKMEYEPVPGLINCLIFISCVFLIKYYDLGFIALFQANALGMVIAMGAIIILLRRVAEVKNIRFDFGLGKNLIKEGYALGISTILLMGSFYVDIFVLKIMKGAADVALFQLPYQLILRLSIIPVSIVSALFPTLSRLSNTRGLNNERLVETIIQAYKVLFTISALSVIYLYVFSGDILDILAGSAFSGASISLKILAWLIFFSFTDFLQSLILVAKRKRRSLIIQNTTCLLLNLALDVILVPYYGYIGACVATVFSFAVRFLIGYYFVCRYLGIISLTKICMKILVAGIAAGLIVKWLSEYTLIVPIIVGMPIFLIILLGLKIISLKELKKFSNNIRA